MKLIMCILVLTLCACSKEVSSTSNKLTPTLTTPVIEVPSDTTSGVLKMNFANHATVNDPEDEITNYSLSEPLLLTLPLVISSVTYSNASYKPNLVIMVNDQSVCVYIWSSGTYRMSQSCYSELDLTAQDVISVRNIPKSQTVSVSVQYQR